MTAPDAPVADDLRVPAWWLAGITVLALSLRLIGLNSGLWIDEIYSLLGSFRPPLSEIVGAFPRDNHHPLYSVLAHLSLRAFGESPWAIRLPAVLFGAATVPLLYGLGAQVAGRREGLLAALLLAVSYHHVWFSQNARGYSMLTFFAVLCTWLLLRGMTTGGWAALAGYAVAAALGAYTHLTMVFVVIGHAAACAAFLAPPSRAPERSRLWRPLVLAFALAGAMTVVLYAPVLPQVREYFAHRPSQLRGISTPRWAALEALRVLAQGFGGGHLAVGAAAIAAALALFAAGLLSYARRRGLALALFFTPALVTVAGALAARGTMYPRFFFSLIGFGILVGVHGVFVAAHWIAARTRPAGTAAARGTRLATAAVGLAIALSATSLPVNYRYPKQDFAGAMRYVEAGRRPGEPVATAGVTTLPYRDYFRRDWIEVATAADLLRLRAGHRVWLVYTFPRYLERAAPEVRAVVDRECGGATAFRGTVGDGDILVCTLGPAT